MKKNIDVALIGNPNCGKTTIFNAVTGGSQYVGNWSGVTVEKKEGRKEWRNKSITFIDLPGKYSFITNSFDEKITREYLTDNTPDLILNIVNANALERHLFLTLQLIEMDLPVVLVVNMIDELEAAGKSIDYAKLEQQLGIKVIPVSGRKRAGITQLLDHVATLQDVGTGNKVKYSQEIESQIEKIMNASSVRRWEAIQSLEGDSQYKNLSSSEDYSSLIAKERYDRTEQIVKVVEKKLENASKLTEKLDEILLNGYFGIPIFLLVMTGVFYFTFTFGNVFVDLIDVVINQYFAEFVRTTLTSIGVISWVKDMIVDGIIGGVGGVITFVPNIALLFIFISLLEDSGYMARAAYIIDRFMQRFGLNGKFFIPMLVGFGCNVPGIMSTRTLQNEKERLVAILINPFMSCGARFPVYILFAGIFFRGKETLVVMSLYLLGVIIAILAAFVLRKTILKSDDSSLVMELPEYRLPTLKNLAINVWLRVKDYLIKAGTVIFAASGVLWFILNFNMHGLTDITTSFGASIGRVFAPIFSLAGFGTWENSLSLLSGVFAKEIVISNTAIIFGLGEGASLDQIGKMLMTQFTPLSAYAFMAFVLLYTPCVAVIGVIKRETNSWGWMTFSIVYQFAIALAVATLIYRVGLLFI